jgi:hypothetical protein
MLVGDVSSADYCWWLQPAESDSADTWQVPSYFRNQASPGTSLLNSTKSLRSAEDINNTAATLQHRTIFRNLCSARLPTAEKPRV